MRRGMILLLATIAAMLVAATGVVLAATMWKPGPGATENNDSYCGDAKSNIADGKGGADTMFAKGGNDYLSGGAGNDAGTGNNDPSVTPATGFNCFGEIVPAGVRGGGEDDFIGVDNVAAKIPGASDEGSDDLVGNEGKDTISDTKNSADKPDYDRVWGGEGNDKVYVNDGDYLDQVDCGEGRDGVSDPNDLDFAQIDVLVDANGNPIKDADGNITRDQTWNCERNVKDQNNNPVDTTLPVKGSQNQLSAASDDGNNPPPEPAERGVKPNKK